MALQQSTERDQAQEGFPVLMVPKIALSLVHK